jgi:hypothetical protein
MERTKRFFDRQKLPNSIPSDGAPDRPNFIADHSFNFFFMMCRKFIGKRGKGTSQGEKEFNEQRSNNERVLLAEYQLSFLFIKCFMCQEFKISDIIQRPANNSRALLLNQDMFRPQFGSRPPKGAKLDSIDDRFDYFVKGVEFLMIQGIMDKSGEPIASWRAGNNAYVGYFILLRLACLIFEKKDNGNEKVNEKSEWFKLKPSPGSRPSIHAEFRASLKDFFRTKLTAAQTLFETNRSLVGKGAPAVYASADQSGQMFWSFTDDSTCEPLGVETIY